MRNATINCLKATRLGRHLRAMLLLDGSATTADTSTRAKKLQKYVLYVHTQEHTSKEKSKIIKKLGTGKIIYPVPNFFGCIFSLSGIICIYAISSFKNYLSHFLYFGEGFI